MKKEDQKKEKNIHLNRSVNKEFLARFIDSLSKTSIGNSRKKYNYFITKKTIDDGKNIHGLLSALTNLQIKLIDAKQLYLEQKLRQD